jgi:hypothetical protein
MGLYGDYKQKLTLYRRNINIDNTNMRHKNSHSFRNRTTVLRDDCICGGFVCLLLSIDINGTSLCIDVFILCA